MKTFYDLTNEEKVALDSEKVQYYARLECANRGIIIPQKPINNLKEVQPPTQKFYQIGYESVVFETEQEAQDYVDAKQKGFQISNMTSNYNSRESYISNRVKDNFEIKSTVLYTKEEAAELKDIIKYNQETQKEWDDYNKASAESMGIESDIWSEMQEINFHNSRVEYYDKVYKDYLELSGGSDEIAFTFFKKAYKDIDLSEIDREIVDAIIDRPRAIEEKPLKTEETI